MTTETESTTTQRDQQRQHDGDSGDVGLTGLNQGEPIPEVELDADDQAQAREALELLDRFEAESGETLDRPNRDFPQAQPLHCLCPPPDQRGA
jgi:hypothetical protein